MAAVAELSFLLFALISNIRAEELITILKEMDFFPIGVPEEADFCLISRFVGEEKLVLWNTSARWSQNSTVPEDLKQRLAVVNRDNFSSYMIQNLTNSDSGQYQRECWTEGDLTYERNISVIVCSTIDEDEWIPRILGEHQDLPCEGAADNLDVQWLKTKFGYKNNIWTRVLGDSAISETDNVTGRPTTSSLHLFNSTAETFEMYNCLVMNREQCVRSQPVQLYIKLKRVFHSVGEVAVLQCIISDFSDDQPPLWKKRLFNNEQELLGRNYSLVLSSLTLNHSGSYSCTTSMNDQWYGLVVCPRFDPPAVELFSEGDEVTLRCRDLEKGKHAYWFMKSNQTEGRVFEVDEITSELRNRLNHSACACDGSLVISNVSLEDTGEYWCAVFNHDDDQCLSTTKTVLKLREPSGIDFTLYTVRCYLLSGLLVVLCVVVVAVNQRTRRGEQRSAETDR